jgi:TPR repeat protein
MMFAFPRAALVLLAFVAIAAHAADTTKSAPAAKPAATAKAPPVDVAADPAGAWARFRAEGEFNRMVDAYNVLQTVELTPSGVNPEACKDAKASLRAAIEEVPVSIALRRADLFCAEAAGDKAHAERAAAALTALARHALAAYGDGAWRRPIQVVQSWDVYALIHTLSYEFRYEYFEDLLPDRHFRLVVAAWDPQKNVERHLAFDYIDTMAAIDRTDPHFGSPRMRLVLSDAFIESLAKRDDIAGVDAQARADASAAGNPRERRDMFREGANAGGPQSISMWLSLCTQAPFPGCADGLIDALLPLVERKQAMQMTQLALAYRNGVGVKKDPATAAKLVDAADARWHRRGASVYYATMLWAMESNKMPADGLERLTRSAEAGNADAQALLLLQRILADPGKPLSAADIAILQAPGNNGQGVGYAVLVEYYEGIGQGEKAAELVRKAAESGHEVMQYRLALELLGKRKDPAAKARGEALMSEAAHGGDDAAMRYMAQRAIDKGEYPAAINWVWLSARSGDSESSLMVADIFAESPKGVDGTLKDAVEFYTMLADQDDYAPARRRLANLALEGRGMDKSPAKARALLLKDAERGDTVSQAILGGWLQDGVLGKPEPREAQRWLDKAAAAGAEDFGGYLALSGNGTWLAANGGTAKERARGIAMLRKAAPEGITAANNLAWALCVSPLDDVLDPAGGLIVARRMLEDFDLDAAELDTVASCYAAVGDYARAVELQNEAIAKLRASRDAEAAENAGIYTRLDLYKAGKPYRQPAP